MSSAGQTAIYLRGVLGLFFDSCVRAIFEIKTFDFLVLILKRFFGVKTFVPYIWVLKFNTCNFIKASFLF